MLPVHGLKRAAKKMRWLFHFGEVSVSKHPLLEARQRCRPFSLFSTRRENGKRYVERAEEKLRAFEQGKPPYSVRYDAVTAMLLNEFLKEHHKVEELEATVVQQQKEFQATVAELRLALKEQAAQIQKVSAQF